jgi:cytochrome c553
VGRARARIALIIGLPLLLFGWTAVAVFAQESPGPGPTTSAPSGDPARGQQLYAASGCTNCHGASLEGNLGPRLNPIEQLPDTTTPLDPDYLISTITRGKSGVGRYSTSMAPKAGASGLTEQDIRDLAAFLVEANRAPGPRALATIDLARSNVFWVTVGTCLLVVVTWLLARYNMRWIARRAAARRLPPA